MNTIIIVDDEAKIRELVKVYLEKQGFNTIEAADGLSAIKLIEDKKPDLVILDIMLPGLDGLEVCKKIRQFSMIPIMMLTAKGEEIDKVLGLELGADDYLVKPFSPRELVARVKALLRRAQVATIQDNNNLIQASGITIDIAARRVTIDTIELVLTPKEFDLLLYLLQNKGQVISREQILEKVWGYDYYGDLRTVDTHIKNLREKLGEHYSTHLKTVWGIGYKFEVAK